MTRFLKNADVTGYISQTSVTSSLLKTDSAGKLVAAVAGTDYNAPGVTASAGTLVREIRNTTGATLTKGTVIYISGATGNKPTVSKALATGDSTSAQTFGLCQTDIANNSNGNVVVIGDITGIDTSAFTEGAQLYLSSTTAGTYTTTKQLAPAHLVYIGVVTRSHPTQGQIEVKIQNGYELDEIHDVSISSLANNQGLFYESATDLWKNKTIAAALGYTPADDAAVVKLTGDQTIAGLKSFSKSENGTLGAVGAMTLGIGTSNDTATKHSGFGFGLNTGTYYPAYIAFVNASSTGSTKGELRFAVRDVTTDTAPTVALTIQTSGAANFASSVTATSFIRSGGTSAQFLKADGSVDGSTYLTSITSSNVTTALGFTPATDSHTHDLMRYSLRAPSNIDGLTTTNFRSTLFGSSSNGWNISAARWNDVPTGLSGMSAYGTMIAWSGSDTQGFIATNYDTGTIQVGGGNANLINWRVTLLHSSNFGSYALPLTGGTLTGNVIASGDTYTTYGPNSTWTSYLRVGGNGRTVTGDTYASMVTTNGNLHLDSGNARAIYLNFYAGTTGVVFGNGASGVAASMDSSGNLWKGSTIGTGTQYVLNSGTWAINITGNAATATNSSQLNGLSSTQLFNNMGQNHSTQTDFNSITNFGFRYVQGNTNGPGTGSTQFYGFSIGLGNEYPFSDFALQLAIPRYNFNTTSGGPDRYLSIRSKESGTWNAWQKISAGYADTAGIATGNVVSRGPSNWNDSTVIGNVVGMLAWKNYGNNHVIFDASQSTSPSGASVDSTNSAVAWTATYPTLMGWNGSTTFGVRVDSARASNLVEHRPSRTDSAWYNIIWGAGNPSHLYSADTVQIQSSTGAVRANIYYDNQDTGYYLDSSSSSTSLSINGGINTTAPGGSILIKHSVSEVDAWIFQENAANWGIYWKNAPTGHHTFGGYTTIGAETFGMSAVNASGNGVATTNFVGATSAVAQWMLSNFTGYIWSASTIFAAGDVRAPIFYDSSNTAFYLDPNGTSNLSRLIVKDAVAGASLLIGSDNVSRVHNDDARKALVINADLYPALHLNAYAGNNATHGAYIVMSGNLTSGGYRLWTMGIANQNPGIFSIGYSDMQDGNGHYGIGDAWSGSDVHHGRLIVDTSGNTKIRGMLYVNGTSGGITTGSAVIHAGNIGSQTVANTTSISSAVGGSYQWTNIQYFLTNNGGYLGSTDSSKLQAYSTGNNSAFMSFHKSGHYAVNFGLDADNVMRIGGWSAAANRWQLDMSGNQTVAGSSTATSFFESSDSRLKTLINESAEVLGIENLQAKLYEKNGKVELGYFAQDAQELMPYSVNENAEGYLNLSYREVHTAKIARLEKRVAELEQQLNLK